MTLVMNSSSGPTTTNKNLLRFIGRMAKNEKDDLRGFISGEGCIYRSMLMIDLSGDQDHQDYEMNVL
uniref:Transposase n=1 Tax=Steinernema glaseri TaxID=37863 RepID=A0A1I8ASN6_9BILA